MHLSTIYGSTTLDEFLKIHPEAANHASSNIKMRAFLQSRGIVATRNFREIASKVIEAVS